MLLDVEDEPHKKEGQRKDDRLLSSGSPWNCPILDEGNLVASLLYQNM